MTAFLSSVVLADIGEVIGSLVGLLMLVLWVIGQLTEGKKQAHPPAARGPAEPPAAPRRPGAPQQAAKPPVAGGLRGEMEEFLRRAADAGKPPQANRPPAAPQRAQAAPADKDKIEVLVNDEGRSLPRQQFAERTRSKGQPPRVTSAKSKPAPPSLWSAPLKRESVAEHVSQHITAATRALESQASRLGQRIVQDDAQFDIQLKAKFDHDVGTLAVVRLTDTPSQSPVNTDTTSPAALLAAALANPVGVRQAIIMNEILRRPSDRW